MLLLYSLHEVICDYVSIDNIIEVLRSGGDPAKVQTPAEARATLQAVTRDDVRAILRKLTLSVSYLLTKEVDAHAAE